MSPRKLFSFLLVCAFCALAQDETREVIAIQESLQAGDLDAASRLIGESLAQHPNDGGLLNLRGIVHARRNQLAEARKDFAQAVRLAPQLTSAWQNLGRACHQLDDLACAVEAWQRVLRTKPNDSEALMLSCLDLSALSRISEAKSAATRLAKHPDFSEADFDGMHGRLDLPRSAAVVASLAEGLDERGAAGLPTLQRLVVAYEQLQRPRDARNTLERVAKLDPNNSTHLLELARLAEKDRDHEVALGYLAHARDLTPGNAQIHYLFGMIAAELDLPVEARNSFQKALAIDPANPSYNYAMGSAILKTRDAATAASYFQNFVAAKPSDAGGHYALGVAYFAAGDYRKAKEEMQTLDGNPKTAAGANYFLGRMARLEGDLETANRHLQRSIELVPSFAESHTELARIRMLEDKLEQARAELNRAVTLDADSFQANEQLLILYKRTHDPRAEKQAEILKKLDADRSRRAELMLRTIEVRP